MKKEMNNKGFSLVELIIVIAIMVILIAVLAPTYLRYVERGRNSRDISNATAMADAVQVYASDPQAGTTFGADATGTTITITDANPVITGANADAVQEALKNAGLADGVLGTLTDFTFETNCASRTAWSGYRITVTVTTDGNVRFTYTGGTSASGTFTPVAGGATDTFADMMAGN